MELLPPYFMLFIIGILGLIIGSFLDVIVCRFHTGKSINGRSRCMSCGHTLSWYELFPLLSYIILRGRCKNCGGYIPLRLFLMELGTSSLFIFVYLHAPTLIHLCFGLVLICVLIVTAIYDIRHMVIPNEMVAGLVLLSLLYAGYEVWETSSFTPLLLSFAGALGTSLFYAGLWAVSKGRWIGLGDAKLAFPLGLMLPLSGAFSFVVLSFWIGAGISVLLLLIQKTAQSGKHRLPILRVPLTMKSEVPFAPFMILAFVIVFWAQANVLSIMAALF